jgi:hypothetical protein
MTPNKEPRLSVRYLLAPLKLLKADPNLTAPLLIARLYFPKKLWSIILARLFHYLTSTGFVRSLKFIIGLGIAGKLNTQLSRFQLNNGKGAASL